MNADCFFKKLKITGIALFWLLIIYLGVSILILAASSFSWKKNQRCRFFILPDLADK